MTETPKDGTYSPLIQQSYIKEPASYGVGDTAAFEFKPLKAGIYNLKVIVIESPSFRIQKWVVTN